MPQYNQPQAPPPQQYAPQPYAPPAPYATTSININQPTAAPQPQHVSGGWYLLPFFFGIIGGIIGWAVVKDRNQGTAKNLLIFGIVWTIIEVVIYYAIGFLITAMLFGG
jgi:hypothetical protein